MGKPSGKRLKCRKMFSPSSTGKGRLPGYLSHGDRGGTIKPVLHRAPGSPVCASPSSACSPLLGQGPHVSLALAGHLTWLCPLSPATGTSRSREADFSPLGSPSLAPLAPHPRRSLLVWLHSPPPAGSGLLPKVVKEDTGCPHSVSPSRLCVPCNPLHLLRVWRVHDNQWADGYTLS